MSQVSVLSFRLLNEIQELCLQELRGHFKSIAVSKHGRLRA